MSTLWINLQWNGIRSSRQQQKQLCNWTREELKKYQKFYCIILSMSWLSSNLSPRSKNLNKTVKKPIREFYGVLEANIPAWGRGFLKI